MPQTKDYETLYKKIGRRFQALPKIRRGDSDEKKQELANLRATIWLDLARQAIEQIEEGSFRSTDVLDRPASLPEDDNILWKRLRRIRTKKTKLTKADTEFLSELNEWIRDVCKTESANASNVRLMLSIVQMLDRYAPHSQEADSVRAFLQTEYAWAGPTPFAPTDFEAEVLKAVREVNVLPTWLLLREPPPGVFVPDDEDAEEEPEGMESPSTGWFDND